MRSRWTRITRKAASTSRSRPERRADPGPRRVRRGAAVGGRRGAVRRAVHAGAARAGGEPRRRPGGRLGAARIAGGQHGGEFCGGSDRAARHHVRPCARGPAGRARAGRRRRPARRRAAGAAAVRIGGRAAMPASARLRDGGTIGPAHRIRSAAPAGRRGMARRPAAARPRIARRTARPGCRDAAAVLTPCRCLPAGARGDRLVSGLGDGRQRARADRHRLRLDRARENGAVRNAAGVRDAASLFSRSALAHRPRSRGDTPPAGAQHHGGGGGRTAAGAAGRAARLAAARGWTWATARRRDRAGAIAPRCRARSRRHARCAPRRVRSRR